MAMDACSVKEQTIRGLLVGCQKAQAEIQAHLDKNFSRQPEKEEKCEVIPPRPNVLDEITDGLTALVIAQTHTVEFIIGAISSKL